MNRKQEYEQLCEDVLAYTSSNKEVQHSFDDETLQVQLHSILTFVKIDLNIRFVSVHFKENVLTSHYFGTNPISLRYPGQLYVQASDFSTLINIL